MCCNRLGVEVSIRRGIEAFSSTARLLDSNVFLPSFEKKGDRHEEPTTLPRHHLFLSLRVCVDAEAGWEVTRQDVL